MYSQHIRSDQNFRRKKFNQSQDFSRCTLRYYFVFAGTKKILFVIFIEIVMRIFLRQTLFKIASRKIKFIKSTYLCLLDT